MKLTEDIYLNKEHPDNLNVKIDNLNNKYGFVGGLRKYWSKLIPKVNKIKNAIKINNKNANFATIVFDCKNSCDDATPV